MALVDLMGTPIQVGNIVLFTKPGAGRNLPGLCFGEVIALTKASVKVHYLDKNQRRVQREEMVEDLTVPPYWTDSNGRAYYKSKGTGNWIDRDPDSIRFYNDRFFIVGNI